MALPPRVRGRFENVKARLQQVSGRITKAANDALEREALEIQKKARAYAPREEGNLEGAIVVEGYDFRRRWVIFVDGSVPDDTGRYTVGDYWLRLHESFDWEPGPGTRAKPGAGPKFLERAYREQVRDALARIRSEIAKATR